MKKFNNNASNAFTLVEMLVVLGMISILMSVTFTGIGRARTQARIAKANSEVRTLMNAWLAYEAAYDDWPVAAQQGKDLVANDGNLAELLGKGDSSTVFLNVQLINGEFLDPWGTPYQFRVLSDSGEDDKTMDYFESAITFPNRMRTVVAP
ncbi:MAG: prepilin-type N-terminal cleavage/methylation domain-containing protein [Kiritimatiellia bacterium]